MSPSGIFRHRAVQYPWSEEPMSAAERGTDDPSMNSRAYPLPIIPPGLDEDFHIEAEAIWHFGKAQDYLRRNERITAPNFKKALEIDLNLNELLVRIRKKQLQDILFLGGFSTCMR